MKCSSALVCRAAKENGARARSDYIDRNSKVAIFTHPQLRDKWHQICNGVSLQAGEATSCFKFPQAIPEIMTSKFSQLKISSFFPSFRTLCKNCYTSRIGVAEIWNIYWGSKGKQQNRILGKFDQHLMSYSQLQLSNFTRKAKSNFCQTFTG